MRDETLSLRASPVRPLPRQNRTWEVGRVCAEPGCGTRLSRYNRSTRCWAHGPARRPAAGEGGRPEAA